MLETLGTFIRKLFCRKYLQILLWKIIRSQSRKGLVGAHYIKLRSVTRLSFFIQSFVRFVAKVTMEDWASLWRASTQLQNSGTVIMPLACQPIGKQSLHVAL